MKFFNKLGIATGAGIGVIALGAMALPAFANTSMNASGSWGAEMRSFMSQTFSSQQQQQFMSSAAMQELRNSPDMQKAMKDQNLGRMESLMNSDQALKKDIGANNVAKMNQLMGQLKGMYQSGK